ncbi:MAG: multicopper oxidase domain-containing protein [Rhodothermales bacterium]
MRALLPILAAVLLLCSPTAQAQPDPGGMTRTYYVAAEEALWDYAPSGTEQMMGRPFTPDDSVFVASGRDRIGSTYLKARYVEYTDSTFTTPKPVPPAWAHKGVLGPVIRAEVGDSIHVVFRNNARRPYSVHPHGVAYSKAHEGAMTADGTTGADRADDLVPPGGTYTYRWFVPERAGPGPADPSSIVWLYHSHIDPTADINTGLVGVLLVTRRGAADAEGRPADVDREFVTLFNVFDENRSWYLAENARRTIPDADLEALTEDEVFVEGNLMHAMNGFVFGNLPLLQMTEGERVRWYLVGLGTEIDIHTPHWHGNTVLWNGHRTDVLPLMPAVMLTADMVPDSPGIWMYHCHVDDHLDAGMTGRYEVIPRR